MRKAGWSRVPPFTVTEIVEGATALPGSNIKNGEKYIVYSCEYVYCKNGNRYFWYVGVIAYNGGYKSHDRLTPRLFKKLLNE
jgi:hypothetical protein